MLVYEYKLAAAPAQYAQMDEAIRVAQFVRNTCLRKWRDEHRIGANELQAYCAVLAKAFAFAATRTSPARQAAADRAWAAIQRFYAHCRAKTPGKKGYPRFQHANRSVEYKVTGWKLAPDGKHLTFTEGCGLGRVRLVGTRAIETFPGQQIKRVRRLRRADGYYVQFCVDAERHVAHLPTGRQVGIDLGLRTFYTDSEGQTVPNPRFLRHAERRLSALQRQVSRKSNATKAHRTPGRTHQARKRQRRSRHPGPGAGSRPRPRPRHLPVVRSPAPSRPAPAYLPASSPGHRAAHRPQSHNYHQARQRLARAHLHVQRPRADCARTTASALVWSSARLAYDDLQIRNLVRNHHLAKSLSDAAWARFLVWAVYYARLHGIPLLAVPSQYTTQACSGCGALVQKTLSTRTHRCGRCGLVRDRDENAARNILALALGIWQEHQQRQQDLLSTAGQAGTGSA